MRSHTFGTRMVSVILNTVSQDALGTLFGVGTQYKVT